VSSATGNGRFSRARFHLQGETRHPGLWGPWRPSLAGDSGVDFCFLRGGEGWGEVVEPGVGAATDRFLSRRRRAMGAARAMIIVSRDESSELHVQIAQHVWWWPSPGTLPASVGGPPDTGVNGAQY
jgi:hypothetical protein